ncbi:MAG: ATP-binding cassette domain-containing protein, partial [Halobacteriota archaeon]
MIEVEGLDVAYGDLQVLWDVTLEVTASDGIVAIVGPNGAGKTTLLKTLSGLIEPVGGSISLFGEDIAGLAPDEIVERGFVHVPEARNLFTEMSVVENLEMGAFTNRPNKA